MNSRVIDRFDAKPLYVQIKDRIRAQIAAGVYKTGDPLPSEREMCKIHGVSHITTRQALVQLTQEGVLFRVQGKGTYVGDTPSTPLAAPNVGLVILESEGAAYSPFIMDFMTGIKAVTSEHQASLSVYTVTEASYIVDVSEGRLQGVITLVSQIHDRVIPMLAGKRIPLVVVGDTDVPGVYSVDNDNVAIGTMMASHLLELGHRRIGFIGGPRPFTMTEARLKGYQNALQAAGIQPEDRFERFGKHASETGNHFAPELVEQGATAIMCADDTIALGALNALHTLGKRVPEDVAVVGSNNSGFTLHTWPPLTTVDTHVTSIGRSAAEVLMQALDGQKPPQRTIIDSKLVIRASSVAPETRITVG